MAKVIPEEEKNYNKFPGEHVIVLDDVVTIGDKVFHLIYNHREGFNQEKLEQRYSDIFAKYDYLVGDWGHEQLRLKGFFSSSRKKMPDELKISHLEDYIKEYMNFGAAFFVLKRMRSKDIKRDEAFVDEKVYEVTTPVAVSRVSKKDTKKEVKKEVRREVRREVRKDVKKDGNRDFSLDAKTPNKKGDNSGSSKFSRKRQPSKTAFVKKEKSVKQQAPIIKPEPSQKPHQSESSKRPAFVVRTRKK
ncbi:MAG: YutD family protein [Pseudolactococcus laudensis]